MTTSTMREAWLPIDISLPLIYCMKCFRTTTSHNGGFYVMECGHIFCDSHVEIANVSNVASQNFPMNHSCPHCKLTDISVYRIGPKNAHLPPDLAVHFDDFLLSLKRYFESIKYNYESLTFLIRHYQSLPNASELEKQVRHQKDVIAKMVPALEKSALWESFVTSLYTAV
ncbi:hypothetical protein BZA70DRAFT_20641 [Myxozyma melibiosi]|uniref:RING-type domain-containing protein n=1 Tax=Myxozyma melibiosi TaxID=54550 RepID=A0ABR1FCS3_9ASCO